MNVKLSGNCLCGAVAYTCSEEPSLAAHCACIDCRKSSGTSHGTHVPVSQGSVIFSGAAASFANPADSGNTVTRYFCGNCGCAIYSTNSAMPNMVFLRASSLEDPDAVEPSMYVYKSRAPKWAAIGEGLVTFEEMPPQQSPQEVIDASRG